MTPLQGETSVLIEVKQAHSRSLWQRFSLAEISSSNRTTIFAQGSPIHALRVDSRQSQSDKSSGRANTQRRSMSATLPRSRAFD
jgi:hypothetical protein